MVNFTAYQDVECVYQISGQYGNAPRALYYCLLIFVICFRRQDWLAVGAAAYCLGFGGAGTVHAILLAPSLSLGHTSVHESSVQLSNGTLVIVNAVATDLDSDATLAIVGTGFMITVPMALWSSSFKHSGAVPVLVLWMVLMFMGMIACLVNLYSINGGASGPLRQFRFCSPDFADSLPFNGPTISIINNSWNDTMWSYFENHSTMSSCYYPCAHATEILRQPGDATIIKFLDINPPDPRYWGMLVASAVIYGCVPLNILFCFMILIFRLHGYKSDNKVFRSTTPTRRRDRVVRIATYVINTYGRILSPFVFVVFLGWIEWVIAYDLQSESVNMVGQWAPIISVGLAFIAALVGKYGPKTAELWCMSRKRRGSAYRINEMELEEYIPSSSWGRSGVGYQQGFDSERE